MQSSYPNRRPLAGPVGGPRGAGSTAVGGRPIHIRREAAVFDPAIHRSLSGETPEERKAREKRLLLQRLGAGLSGIPVAGAMLNAGLGWAGDQMYGKHEEERMRKAAALEAAMRLARRPGT